MLPRLVLLGCPGSGTSVGLSLRDLFPEWLRHEGKSCPRERPTENPPVVGFVTWAIRCANTGTAFGREADFASLVHCTASPQSTVVGGGAERDHAATEGVRS
ncbi:hypothetical protein GCM10027271_28230 [Saccharopolyspora gloriosae]